MGFCWPAFFFGPLWAWRKGMVVLGFLLLALLQLAPLLLVEIVGDVGIVVDLIVTVGILTVIGGQGNAWLRRSMLNRGFKLSDEGEGGQRSETLGLNSLSPGIRSGGKDSLRSSPRFSDER